MTNLLLKIQTIFTGTRFPTLFGLGILILGLGAGVYLAGTAQNTTTKASVFAKPEGIAVVNLTDRLATITWSTKEISTGAISFGATGSTPEVVIDDRDSSSTPPQKKYFNHFVTLKNLLPQTSYQYHIISDGVTSDTVDVFTTANTVETSTAAPLIGSVPQLSQNPDAIAYLEIPGFPTQAALVTQFGSFTIPLTQIPILNSSEAKLRVVSALGEARATILLDSALAPIPPLKLGEDLLLTTPVTKKPLDPKSVYDLNGDRIINSNDEAILKNNFGIGFQDPKADIDGNSQVDDKDLKLLRSQF